MSGRLFISETDERHHQNWSRKQHVLTNLIKFPKSLSCYTLQPTKDYGLFGSTKLSIANY